MDPNKLRPSRPRTLDSVGSSAARPAGRPAGSAHVIDLREKSSSFNAPAAVDTKPSVVKKKQPERSQVPVAAPPPTPAPSPAQSSKQAATPPPRQRSPQQDRYTDAAFPAKPRFWPAFWRFLFLLILLGLIISLGVYIYFSYYQR
ncbi:MAG TPA: hypothetical protein VF272_02630 [Candidatus Saccharimonadia bacterium]